MFNVDKNGLLAIGFIDETNKKGYTANVKSLLNLVNGTAIDVQDYQNMKNDFINFAQSSSHLIKEVYIIGSSDFGKDMLVNFMNDSEAMIPLENMKKTFFLIADRFYNNFADMPSNIVCIMPQVAIRRIQEHTTIINYIITELMPAKTEEQIKADATKFRDENEKVAKFIDNINSPIFFIGGRVQKEDSTWIENTPEIFAETAELCLKECPNNSIFVIHGYRSLTNASGENDFTPINALYSVLREKIGLGKTICIATKTGVDGEKARNPVLKILQKNIEGYVLEQDIPVVDTATNLYYFLIDKVVKNKKQAFVTAEQMTFAPELMNAGGTREQIEPIYWELCVDSNVKSYEKIKDTNFKIINAIDAFKMYLDDNNNKSENKKALTTVQQKEENLPLPQTNSVIKKIRIDINYGVTSMQQMSFEIPIIIQTDGNIDDKDILLDFKIGLK
ncbi:MAG: hypothetical protein Ta2D_13360 [Rickettsiales bacterium]|nr:MAG: hypothetical protein Ta2D_13360 [Rickettsiales bacterium]